ncbi:porin [Histidinibacterium aquaticum]|uniref:Porin n=1 Tax=Histidinibacterium aquaticum TaxID=2613962 RepID=A0A5J5GDG0_9RHOB|nr:porin [Histidinibacterium aquaticum]KAA9005990.1 porin [Histidinibacterium aquaticum]
MKSILLASASIVAFAIAGAAQAEVTFGGSATLGFNDDDDGDEGTPASNAVDDHDGFYWDATITIAATQDLDNGLTVGFSSEFDIADDNLGLDLESGSYVLSMTSEMASLFYGDTAFAAETYYEGVGDLDSDGFSEADGETVLRGEAMFGGFTLGMSYVIADADGDHVGDDANVDGDVDQLSLGANGEFGNFTVGFAYQEESDANGPLVGDGVADNGEAGEGTDVYDPVDTNGDFNTDEIFAIFGSTSVAGADISLAYASNETQDTTSTGVGVSYPVGPVVLGFEYGFNPDSLDTYELMVGYANGPVTVDASYSDNEDGTDEEYSVDASYDAGNNLTVFTGVHGGEDNTDELDYYVGGTLGLSDAASMTVSYAVDDDESEEDEIGAPEYQQGTTVEFSFDF